MVRITVMLVDIAAMWVASTVTFAATQSPLWAFGAVVVTAAYGIWCHYQGAQHATSNPTNY